MRSFFRLLSRFQKVNKLQFGKAKKGSQKTSFSNPSWMPWQFSLYLDHFCCWSNKWYLTCSGWCIRLSFLAVIVVALSKTIFRAIFFFSVSFGRYFWIGTIWASSRLVTGGLATTLTFLLVTFAVIGRFNLLRNGIAQRMTQLGAEGKAFFLKCPVLPIGHLGYIVWKLL